MPTTAMPCLARQLAVIVAALSAVGAATGFAAAALASPAAPQDPGVSVPCAVDLATMTLDPPATGPHECNGP